MEQTFWGVVGAAIGRLGLWGVHLYPLTHWPGAGGLQLDMVNVMQVKLEASVVSGGHFFFKPLYNISMSFGAKDNIKRSET